jgi:outer membrane cobalamin receptor
MFAISRSALVLIMVLLLWGPISAFAEETDDSYALPDMVVTASRSVEDPDNVPADLKVFSESEIQIPQNKNVLDALAIAPGIKINNRQNNGIFGGGVDVHGLQTNATSGGNLLFMLDGVPQRRLSFGGPYFGALPHSAVNRMELVEGALTTQYGRGAMLGTLQMFTDPVVRDRPYTELSVNFESETAYVQTVLKGTVPLEGEGGYISGTLSTDQADGWQENTASNHSDGYFNSLFLLSDRQRIKLFGGVYSGDEDVATPVFVDENGDLIPYMAWDANLSTGHNYLKLEEKRIGGSWMYDWNNSLAFKATLAYWSGETEWGVNRPWSKPSDYGIDNPLIGSVRYMTLFWDEESFFSEAMVTRSYGLAESLSGSLSAGVNYERFDWDNVTYNYGTVSLNAQTGAVDSSGLNMDADPTVMETEAVFWGPFLINTLRFGEAAVLQGGLRYDNYQNDQEDVTRQAVYSGDQDFVSPSLGGIFHWLRKESVQSSFFANWGRNYNPVTRTGVSAGILDADPEKSETFEAGLRGSFWGDKADARVSYYHIDRTDVPQRDGLGQYTHAAEWQIKGFGLSFNLTPAEAWTLFASLDFPDPKIKDDKANPDNNGNRIMFAGEHLIELGARYQPFENVYAEFQTRHVDETYADSANTILLPDYWLTDVSVGFAVGNMSFVGFVKNVFDQKYYSGAFDSSGGMAFAGTPVTFGVGVKIHTY